METMSALDASFLHLEDAVSHMHIGSVAIFEGPAPAQADVLAAITGKLPLVPRYRQRVRSLPLTLGRPSWVDDPHFRLDYHVRRTALPAPGGDLQLRNLTAQLFVVAAHRLQREVVVPRRPDAADHRRGAALDFGERSEGDGLEERDAPLGVDLRRDEEDVADDHGHEQVAGALADV